MLPDGYEPLPPWQGAHGNWNHVETDPRTGEVRLADFPADLKGQSYFGAYETSLVIRDEPAAWHAFARGRSSLLCRQRRAHGRVGRDPVSFAQRCRNWTCPECGPQHAMLQIAWIYQQLVGQRAVRLIWLPGRPTQAQQRSLGRTLSWDHPANKAWYAMLTLTRGRGTLIAVLGDPGGDLGQCASTITAAAEAFEVFRDELRLPERLSVTGANFAPSYRRGGAPPQPRGRVHMHVSGLTANQSEAFRSESHRLADERYAMPFPLLDPTAMDAIAQEAALFARAQPP